MTTSTLRTQPPRYFHCLAQHRQVVDLVEYLQRVGMQGTDFRQATVKLGDLLIALGDGCQGVAQVVAGLLQVLIQLANLRVPLGNGLQCLAMLRGE